MADPDNSRTQERGDFRVGRSVSDPDGNMLETVGMDMNRTLKAQRMAV